MNKGLVAVGALIASLVLAGVVWFQWGQHVELNGRVTAVRHQGVTDADTVVVVDCDLTNPADVPFEVEDVEATVQPASGEAMNGDPVAVVDAPRLVAAYPALQGSSHAALKTRDVIAPRQSTRRTLMFQFAGVKAEDFAARKAFTVKIRERLGAVGVIQEAR